jgi:hypothetical protein
MTETLTIVINRGDNSMATSFLVWGKFRAYPQCDGDGVFVAEVEIEASETVTSYEWDTPNNQLDWKFIAAPKFNEIVGIFGQLESA